MKATVPIRPQLIRDLTGQRFGLLVVLTQHPERRNRKVYWRCRCDCGEEVVTRGTRLTRGSVKSCGCLRREATAARSKDRVTHGMSGTREYHSWSAMRHRCLWSDHHSYPNYGGRGITVCARWLGSEGFANFYEDMGPRPEGTSLDRIDNDDNYEPSNCRWATKSEQEQNKRREVS